MLERVVREPAEFVRLPGQQQREQQRRQTEGDAHASAGRSPILSDGPQQKPGQRFGLGVVLAVPELGQREQQRERFEDTVQLLDTQPVQAARQRLPASAGHGQHAERVAGTGYARVRDEHDARTARHLRTDVGGGREHFPTVADRRLQFR